MIAAVLRCITVALAIAITNADGDTENQKLPPVVLNATTLPILRGSPRFAAVRFARAGDGGETFDGYWQQLSWSLPPGTVWRGDCGEEPKACDACGDAAAVKAWTGDGFVAYPAGAPKDGPSLMAWLQDLDRAAPPPGAAIDGAPPPEADNSRRVPKGRLAPWTGQALPALVFRPTAKPDAAAKKRRRTPTLLYFHGGNDGPEYAAKFQSVAYYLDTDKQFAKAFPFLFLQPCTECQRDRTMVHRGNFLYSAEDASTRPAFGEVGFTNRNLVRVDRVLDAALEKFQGDPKRVILTSTSYGGRGLYHYAAKRPGVFAALVPMAASLYPTPSLARSLCCESGAPECCPAVRHFVGANDRPLMVGGHDAWDREYESQTRRKTAYAYTKFPWAPPPRQPDYAYMTGHAPDRLAWLKNASLIEWMLDVDCDECKGAAPYSEALLAMEVVVEPPAVAGPATQLHGAVKFGTLEDVRALVDAGADLAARDAGDKERTPLHVACHLARDDVVRLLVDRGADLDAREVQGWRPIHEVAHAGGLATAKHLLDAGADLDARADGGWHALHQASGNGHPDLVRLFLDAGARADVRAENTMEPIHVALQMAHPKVAALLIPALDGVVDLRGYKVGEQGILALAAALGTAKATSISIANAGFGREGLAALVEALQDQPALAKLDVTLNNLPAQAGPMLARILDGAPALEVLEASGNFLQDAGVAALAPAVERHPSLALLGLHKNELGDAAAAALAAALASGAPALAYLGLNMNGIGDDGAAALAEGLPRFKALSTLKLDNNALHGGVAALRAAAEELPRELELHLNGNPGVGGASMRTEL